MIQVLIVEDSPTQRQLLRSILESDPELKVVGEARHGEEAVKLSRSLRPNIITMDIQMPKMNGYEAIRQIMAESPCPIIVLTSTRSDIELGVSYKALETGALMVTRKPQGPTINDSEALALIAQVKTMSQVRVVRRRTAPLQPALPPLPFPVPSPAPGAGPKRAVGIVALGASTGGPPALQMVLSQLPPDFPAPIVVVQHISTGFVGGLVKWLHDTTPLAVKLAVNGETLAPATVFVAPDHHQMTVSASGYVWLRQIGPVDGHRPSVTALFNSVAQNYGRRAVGVLLTGMGRDGADGMKAIYAAGGLTIAQNQESSVVFGMPKAAIELGAAAEVLPLEQIGHRLRGLTVNKEIRI
ncbi:MAG: chemotaxis-specific protein-glutamate methyltransferase CheB [Anaerolineae bacterium]